MHVRDYLAKGHKDVSEIMEQELAATRSEISGRASDFPWKNQPPAVNPHHITNVIHKKIHDEELVEVTDKTRGGRSVSVLVPVDQKGRTTEIEKAAARKRLLMARFLGWATGTARHPRGLIGEAGERVVHGLLRELAPEVGYQLVRPSADPGDVPALFGQDIPGGPLDDVAHLTISDSNGFPIGHVTVLVEVKNTREWIYRDNDGLHQLLYKAAELQAAHPDRDFLPVLICRRAQNRTFVMAKELGIFVIQSKTQFVLPNTEVDSRKLVEVKRELGFRDLDYSTDTRWQKLLRSQLEKGIPKAAPDAAAVWKEKGSQLSDVYDVLRRPHPLDEQAIAMQEIYEAMGIGSDPEADWAGEQPELP